MNSTTQNRSRVFAALACLLAVVFLYAPLASAAWMSHSMACCTGGYCDIAKHHHAKTPANSAAGEDCGHDMGMMNCSMSCCQDPDKPVVTSLAFVMPPAAFTSSATIVTRAAERVRRIEIPRTIAPLSPPPRIDNSLL